MREVGLGWAVLAGGCFLLCSPVAFVLGIVLRGAEVRGDLVFGGRKEGTVGGEENALYSL